MSRDRKRTKTSITGRERRMDGSGRKSYVLRRGPTIFPKKTCCSSEADWHKQTTSSGSSVSRIPAEKANGGGKSKKPGNGKVGTQPCPCGRRGDRWDGDKTSFNEFSRRASDSRGKKKVRGRSNLQPGKRAKGKTCRSAVHCEDCTLL